MPPQSSESSLVKTLKHAATTCSPLISTYIHYYAEIMHTYLELKLLILGPIHLVRDKLAQVGTYTL